MMAVECGRRVFQEIRICFTKDLRGFAPAPRSTAPMPVRGDHRQRRPMNYRRLSCG